MSSNQQNQTDIEQILNEVEELRKELSSEAETVVDTHAVAKEMADVLSEAQVPTPAVSTQATKEMDTAFPAEASNAGVDVSADDLMKEFHASLESGDASSALGSLDADDSMEITLAEFKDDPSVKTLLDETFDDQARRQVEKEAPIGSNEMSNSVSGNAASAAPVSSSDESSPSLTMSLTGSMTLKLKYEFAGQEVTVGFTDEFLKIELADGTEFKIPVGRQKSLRRVA